jgi:hypothetical protein
LDSVYYTDYCIWLYDELINFLQTTQLQGMYADRVDKPEKSDIIVVVIIDPFYQYRVEHCDALVVRLKGNNMPSSLQSQKKSKNNLQNRWVDVKAGIFCWNTEKFYFKQIFFFSYLHK